MRREEETVTKTVDVGGEAGLARTGERPDDPRGAAGGIGRFIGSILAILALSAVLAMITWAVVRIGHVSGSAGGVAAVSTERAYRHETPNHFQRDLVPDLQQAPAVLTGDQLGQDVFFHVRTGEATLLPRSIRSISGAGHYQPSPDGSMLAFDDGSRVYVADVDGDHVRPIVPSALDGQAPAWSPDGRKIVFESYERCFVVDLRSGRIRRVLSDRNVGEVYRAVFSPDGRRILFTRRRGGALALWTVPVSGGHPRVVLRRAAFGTYSPDGTTIAFRRTVYDGFDFTEMTAGVISLVDPDGDAPRQLSGGLFWMSQVDPMALWPDWSPDGSKIAFERSFLSTVTVIDATTGAVLFGVAGSDPSWLDDQTLIVEDYAPEGWNR